jgi:ribosomal protein S18 acetylase RimI-like enzyme
MINLRRAVLEDLDFLVRIDLKVDGLTSTTEISLTSEEAIGHSNKITEYIIDFNKGSFILEDSDNRKMIGVIMYSIENRDISVPRVNAASELDRHLFQADGRFLEIFQLWVHLDYRRQGLATQLKKKLEEEALFHDVNLIYTHTEESNHHVIQLNTKLGYKEVRRGPVWDSVIRVSLIKHLEGEMKSG